MLYNNVQMKKRDIEQLGCPKSCLDLAMDYLRSAAKCGMLKKHRPQDIIRRVVDNPSVHFEDHMAAKLARAIVEDAKLSSKGPAPYKIWGEMGIENGAIEQLREACKLPISYRAALLPDGHSGYGLPIGGVLATVGSVIPHAVGVDIACRMRLTVTDIPVQHLDDLERFKKAIEDETRFGIGCEFEKKRQHPVMDMDWSVSDVTKRMKSTAWAQLGTSGSGNHFINLGIMEFYTPISVCVPGQKYLAIMTHSGSRGTGGKVCDHYHKIAKSKLPSAYAWASNLPWLNLDTEAGQEYWAAMTLMGHYAAANHECIHRGMLSNLGAQEMFQMENHHNFCWREIHDNMEVIVHRKGATPAHEGVMGIIPGSMASPAYLVEGLGNVDSLKSASHGAGRAMSRTQAKAKFNWEDWHKHLAEKGVTLISGGIDEVPGAYKDIKMVMKEQTDLVKVLAKFEPKLVKMAGEGPGED